MRITIPENEIVFGAGASSLNALISLQLQLSIMTRSLNDKYPKAVVDNVESFEYTIVKRMIIALDTFLSICIVQRDYDSAAGIVRSIADKGCALALIYKCEDSLEKEYRHYLFVLDCLRERRSLLREHIEYNGRISREEFEALTIQMDNARQDTDNAIAFVEDKLNSHSYASNYPIFHNAVVKQAEWKFSNVGVLSNKGKVISKTWKELYSLIDSRPDIISMYSSYLSQFVHGLSFSIALEHCSFDNFESLISVGICLQGFIRNILIQDFDGERQMKDNFTLNDLHLIFPLFGEEKRAEMFSKIQEILNNPRADEK